MDNWLRMLFIMTCKDNNNITYKKLIPQDDGTCFEETKLLDENTIDDLICFMPDQNLHIFCICLEGVQKPIQKIEYHLNVVWSETIKQRQRRYIAEKYMYSNGITFCQTIEDFVYSLYNDMVNCECIVDKSFGEFFSFFKKTYGYDKNKFESLYHDVNSADIAFIYLISSEVYQTLMHRYNLPRLGSVVVKIPTLELIEKSDKALSHENEDDDRTKNLNRMIKELSIEKQNEVNIFVEKIYKTERNEEMYKVSEFIEDKGIKPGTIEK